MQTSLLQPVELCCRVWAGQFPDAALEPLAAAPLWGELWGVTQRSLRAEESLVLRGSAGLPHPTCLIPSLSQAGMASPENPEQLIIALEPEAASIYCRKLRLHQMIDLSSRAPVNGYSPSDTIGTGFTQGTAVHSLCRSSCLSLLCPWGLVSHHFSLFSWNVSGWHQFGFINGFAA